VLTTILVGLFPRFIDLQNPMLMNYLASANGAGFGMLGAAGGISGQRMMTALNSVASTSMPNAAMHSQATPFYQPFQNNFVGQGAREISR
jgi:hypothetical protein